MAGMFPFYILREWDNSGKLLAGGMLYFYESGTLTPKATYTSHLLNVPSSNPVVLDAGGAADIWLGDGAYRVLVTDANGVQIRSPIDGVMGVGGGTIDGNSTATMAVLKAYGDLRSLTSVPDVVYVTGRLTEADGGAGLFQLYPSSVETDDDGIVLVATAGTHIYKRVFDGVIDPRWYGVAYGTGANQSSYLLAAANGSARHRAPVDVKGMVYLSTNVVIPDGAILNFARQSFLHAGSTVSVEFAAGSKLSGEGVIFGDNVNPIFHAGACDALRLSWFGGATDDDRWDKAIASTTHGYSLLVDVNTTIATNLDVSANFAVDFVDGTVIEVIDAIDVSIPNMAYTGISQVFQYNDIAYIGAISLGEAQGCIEWYGGDAGSTDNRIAFKAALKSGNFRLLPAKAYSIQADTPYVLATPASIQGAVGSTLQLNNQFTVGDLTLKEMSLASTIFITCATATVTDSTIAAAILCTAGSIYRSIVKTVSNVVRSSESTFASFQGILEGHCDNTTFECSAPIATINSFSLDFCKFTKIAGSPIMFKPEVGTVLTFNACDFGDITDTLFYGEPITYAQLVSCTSANNFSMPISTSVDYMRVSLVGCGAVNNSTAWSIDGYTQDIAKYVKLQAGDPMFTPITASTSYWYGIGGATSDGAALTLATAASLASDPEAVSNLRYRGKADDTSDIYQLFRYGGYVDTQIKYPAGYTPNTASKITTAIVIPNTLGISATIFHLRNNVLGVNNAANSPATAGTEIKYRTNVWGGQTEYKVIPGPGNSAINDVWGDFAQFIAPGAKVFCVPRLVIYDQGAIGLPAGTKLTVTICPALPNTKEHYDRFWPKSIWGIFYDPSNPLTTGSLCVHSLSLSYGIGAYQLYTPYVFRAIDSNGLQVALIRKPYTYGGSGPTGNALPITVWSNGDTLDNDYL